MTKTTYTEGNSTTYGKNMDDISGKYQYDAARANWGGSWRLPSTAEWSELKNQCTWIWTTQGDHNGYKVTSSNGNSIFLPAAGSRLGLSLYNTGNYGNYWTSTPYGSDTQFAYFFYFNSDSHLVYWNYRYYGRSVRPVSE